MLSASRGRNLVCPGEKTHRTESDTGLELLVITVSLRGLY